MPSLLKTSPRACPKAPREANTRPFTERLNFIFFSTGFLLSITRNIPDIVTAIPVKLSMEIFSPMIRNPTSTVMGGAADIISNDILEPISTKALMRNISPKTKPSKPDTDSQNQIYTVASVGKIKPLVINKKIPREPKATNNLI